jgi:hypothetical protein
MTLEVIGVITLVVGLLSIISGLPFVINMFFCSMLFGSAAAFILTSLGGTSILPPYVLLGFLAIKLLSTKDCVKRVREGLAFGRPGFWLALMLLDCTISAFFMPRLFEGQILVFPVRAMGYVERLAPATANLTQSIYLFGDFVCFVLLCAYAATPGSIRIFGSAVLLCVTLNLIFAVIDWATYLTNTTVLLSFIRNASYGMLTEVELAGSKRLVGSFAEASSFGSMTLGYFAFTSKLWLLGIRPRLTFSLAGLSLFAVLLSKSSTAYAGLAVVLGLGYLEAMISAIRGRLSSQATWFLVGFPIVLPALMIAIALNDNYLAYIQDLLDQLIFNKMSTASGIERSALNSQGLQNFFDTFGLGVGNGSMRTSSFPIAVLGSLGIVGATIVSLFLATIFFRARQRDSSDMLEEAYRDAAKSACFAWLMTVMVAGAVVDLGLHFFAFAAFASSKSNIDATMRRRPHAGQYGGS